MARTIQKTKLDTLEKETLRFGSYSERHSFFQGMATLLGAGIPLHQALDKLAESAEASGQLKYAAICQSLHFRVSSGSQTFYQAICSLPSAFGGHVRRCVGAGEQNGRLPETFTELVVLEERLLINQKEMQRVLLYPLGITLLGFGIGSFSLLSLQSLLPFYEDIDSKLSDVLRLIQSGQQAVLNPYFLIPMFLGLAFFLSGLLEEKVRQGLRLFWYQLWRHMPGFGHLMALSANIQFCRALSRQLDAGIRLENSLETAMMVANDPFFDAQLRAHLEEERSIVFHYPIFKLLSSPKSRANQKRFGPLVSFLQEGHTLSELLDLHPDLFLPGVRTLARSGEEAATLPVSLDAAADILQVEFESKVETFKAIVGPALLLVTGLFVGFVAVLSLYPVLNAIAL